MIPITSPLTEKRDEQKERYGEYYAIQEADVQTELDIEKELFATMINLHRNFHNSDIRDLEEIALNTLTTLEYSKNLLVKYISPQSPLIQKVNLAVIELRNYPEISTILEFYIPLRDEILQTFAFLGFRRAKNPTYKWVDKALERMQIPPNPVVDAMLEKKKGKLNKLVHLIAYSTEEFKEQRDAIIINTGDRGSGKTRIALRMAYKLHKATNRPFNLKKNVIYTDIADLSKRLLTEWKMLIAIDEGYFAAKNLDVLKRQVKDLMDVLSAVRNRGHIVIINFLKINRAAKTLLEIANYWIHKPNMDHGILYMRDREFVGDDSWSVEDLLKAKTLSKKRWLMRHNPNYICTMNVRRLPGKIFEKYDKYKKEAQEAKGANDASYKESEQQKEYIIRALLKDFDEKKFDMNNAGFYIEQVYQIPKRLTLGIQNTLRQRISQQELYNKMKNIEKENEVTI